MIKPEKHNHIWDLGLLPRLVKCLIEVNNPCSSCPILQIDDFEVANEIMT